MLDQIVEERGIQSFLNIDESAIFFEMANDTTLDIQGKSVTGIFSTGANKQRCTLLMSIITNDQTSTFAPPVIILKNTSASTDGRVFSPPENPKGEFKELIKQIRALTNQKDLLILENKSGWNNSFLMKEHIIPFLASSIDSRSRESMLLFLDNCRCHTEESVYTRLSEEFNVLYFPPDCTALLQPVDVAVAKSLKASIKKKFLNHVTKNFQEIVTPKGRRKKTFKNPSKYEVIEWVMEGYKTLKKETIRSGFVEAGLTGDQKEERRNYLLEKKNQKVLYRQ